MVIHLFWQSIQAYSLSVLSSASRPTWLGSDRRFWMCAISIRKVSETWSVAFCPVFHNRRTAIPLFQGNFWELCCLLFGWQTFPSHSTETRRISVPFKSLDFSSKNPSEYFCRYHVPSYNPRARTSNLRFPLLKPLQSPKNHFLAYYFPLKIQEVCYRPNNGHRTF